MIITIMMIIIMVIINNNGDYGKNMVKIIITALVLPPLPAAWASCATRILRLEIMPIQHIQPCNQRWKLLALGRSSYGQVQILAAATLHS